MLPFFFVSSSCVVLKLISILKGIIPFYFSRFEKTVHIKEKRIFIWKNILGRNSICTNDYFSKIRISLKVEYFWILISETQIFQAFIYLFFLKYWWLWLTLNENSVSLTENQTSSLKSVATFLKFFTHLCSFMTNFATLNLFSSLLHEDFYQFSPLRLLVLQI